MHSRFISDISDYRRHPRRSSVYVMVGDISGALRRSAWGRGSPYVPDAFRHLRLQKTYPMRLRHLQFWDILVRRCHWWSCPTVFHCDILNPSAGLNIYLVITSLLVSHITPYCRVTERGCSLQKCTPSYVKSFQILDDIMMY